MRTFSGHTDGVRAVAISPDGSLVASGSGDMGEAETRDYTVRIWNTRTGQIILRHSAGAHRHHPGNRVHRRRKAGCFGQRRLAAEPSAGERGTEAVECRRRSKPSDGVESVRNHIQPCHRLGQPVAGVWHVRRQCASPAPCHGPSRPGEFSGRTASVETLAFSPDGGQLAAAGRADAYVRRWDVERKRDPQTMVGPEGRIHAVAFSRDQRWSAAAGYGRGAWLRVWDREHREVWTVRPDLGSFGNIAFTPDGRELLAAGGIVVRRWELDGGRGAQALVGPGPIRRRDRGQ